MGDYQVVGECAHAVVTDVSGVSAMQLLYKGAFLPEGVDADRLEHLLAAGLVAKVEGVPVAPNMAVAQDGNVGIPPLNQAEVVGAEVDVDRAEAQAKLDEIGKPDGRSSEAVWVEYAVRQGFDFTEAQKAGKAELIQLLKAK